MRRYSVIKHDDTGSQVTIVDRDEIPKDLLSIDDKSELLNALYALHTETREPLEILIHNNIVEV
jgi:hypothetical protein